MGSRCKVIGSLFCQEGLSESLFRFHILLFSGNQPELYSLATLDGNSGIQKGSSFSVEWTRIIPTADRLLVENATFSPNIHLSFSSNGRQTARRLSAQSLTLHPRPSVKLFYFVRPNIFPRNRQRNETFDILLAILNSGYSDLRSLKVENTRLKLVEPTDSSRMASYGLESVSVDGRQVETSFRQEIPRLPTGSSAFIAYNLSSPEPATLASFNVTLLHGEELIGLADERSFR